MGLDMTLYEDLGKEVFSWRKAYHIHNCLCYLNDYDEDEDDCTLNPDIHDFFPDYGMNFKLNCKQINHLLDRCKAVLEDPSRADELLPRMMDGHITSYTEWDYTVLERTVKELPKVLEGATDTTTFRYYTC